MLGGPVLALLRARRAALLDDAVLRQLAALLRSSAGLQAAGLQAAALECVDAVCGDVDAGALLPALAAADGSTR